jgi:activator of HSP90 ATPase
MTPLIQQAVHFSCTQETLYELYMDSAKHTAATGQRARISRRAGGTFTAFAGMLAGRNLLVVPKRLVVQAWRSTGWKRADGESILVLEFGKAAGGSQINLVHINVPLYDHKGVSLGWPKYYWKPWRAYLAAQKRKG